MSGRLPLTPALAADDPALAPDPDLARARTAIERYRPDGREQRDLRRRFLRFIDLHPADAHRRSCREGHLVASALVLDAASGRALLTHHRKLGRWLQLGGHCDGDANLAGVALREAIEESGLAALRVVPEVIDLDIHPIPARPGEPEHLHLDSRFLVLAERAADPVVGPESHDVRWLTPAEAREHADPSLERLLELARSLYVKGQRSASAACGGPLDARLLGSVDR